MKKILLFLVGLIVSLAMPAGAAPSRADGDNTTTRAAASAIVESKFDFREFDPSVQIPTKSMAFVADNYGVEWDIYDYVMDCIAKDENIVMLYFGTWDFVLAGAHWTYDDGRVEAEVWNVTNNTESKLLELKKNNPDLKFYYLADYSGLGLEPNDPAARVETYEHVVYNYNHELAVKAFDCVLEDYSIDPEYADREFDVINKADGTVATKLRVTSGNGNDNRTYFVLDKMLLENGEYSFTIPFKSLKLWKKDCVMYSRKQTVNFRISNTGFPGGYLNFPVEACDIKEYWKTEGSTITVNSADHLRGGSYIHCATELIYPDGTREIADTQRKNADWHAEHGTYDGWYSWHILPNKAKAGEGSNIHGKVKLVLNEGDWYYNDSSEPTKPYEGLFNFISNYLELDYFYTSYTQEATDEQRAVYERLAEVYNTYNERYQAYKGYNLAVRGMYKGLEDELKVAQNYIEKRNSQYSYDPQRMMVYDVAEVEGIIARIQDADHCLIDVINDGGKQYDELAAAILDGFRNVGDVRNYLYKHSDYYKNDQQLPYFLNNIAQHRQYIRHHLRDPYVAEQIIRVYTLEDLQALKALLDRWVADLDAIGSGEGIKQQCGDDLWWTYADGTLSITGSGDMWDYTTATLPWKDCKADITKVELPEGLTSISASAFARTQITDIAIPDGVRFIESSTFDACRALTTVQLPADLVNIGNSAFMSCSNLVEVKGLSDASNLRVVEDAAFYGCSSLKEAVFPASLERLGDMVFSNCTNLERVGINGSVTQLGTDAFANCSSLKDVELNAPISIIGSHCFSRCSSLEVIDLPATLTSIGYLGFYACSSLKKVICRATTPPGLGENAFWQAGTDEITYQSASRKGDSASGTGGASGPDGMDAIQGPGENVVLYVPTESIALYQTAEGWKEFKTIDDIANAPGGITSIKNASSANRKFFTPKDGIIIVSGGQRYNTQGVQK